VVTVLTALGVKTFILDASYIPTRSMMDALQPGDFILINKFLYGARTPVEFSGAHGPLPSVQLPALRDPRRGDVFVFWLPFEGGMDRLLQARQYVKRCAAVPGDTLVVEGGSVQVNGRIVARLEGDSVTRMAVVLPRPGETITVDARTPAILRELVVRDRELSARESGSAQGAGETRSASHVVMNEFYFLLGDRPSLSVDSRHWGLIPRAWIIGTPITVYWSVEPESAHGGIGARVKGIRWSRVGHLVR